MYDPVSHVSVDGCGSSVSGKERIALHDFSVGGFTDRRGLRNAKRNVFIIASIPNVFNFHVLITARLWQRKLSSLFIVFLLFRSINTTSWKHQRPAVIIWNFN
jgi:hypothetical protein